MRKNGGLALLGFVLLVPVVLLIVITFVKGVTFDRGCKGHLKRAADANTVELAKQELGVAVRYLEENNMTSGYTSVVYNTPDEDVGFLYKNLKASLSELEALSKDATPLERSNMLIKLRETILDEGKGTTVTMPSGIALFPNNGRYAVGLVAFLVLGIVGGICIAVGLDLK